MALSIAITIQRGHSVALPGSAAAALGPPLGRTPRASDRTHLSLGLLREQF